MQHFFLKRGGKYRGSTSPTSCASPLLEFYNVAIRAARSADPGVTGLEARESWWWAKAHAIPVARYLGRGSNGTETLRRELEAENEGVRIPSTIRWLCGVQSVKTRQGERTISALSVVQAFANEDTFRQVWKRSLLL